MDIARGEEDLGDKNTLGQQNVDSVFSNRVGLRQVQDQQRTPLLCAEGSFLSQEKKFYGEKSILQYINQHSNRFHNAVQRVIFTICPTTVTFLSNLDHYQNFSTLSLVVHLMNEGARRTFVHDFQTHLLSQRFNSRKPVSGHESGFPIRTDFGLIELASSKPRRGRLPSIKQFVF